MYDNDPSSQGVQLRAQLQKVGLVHEVFFPYGVHGQFHSADGRRVDVVLAQFYVKPHDGVSGQVLIELGRPQIDAREPGLASDTQVLLK
jgi:hypothetical protein